MLNVPHFYHFDICPCKCIVSEIETKIEAKKSLAIVTEKDESPGKA